MGHYLVAKEERLMRPIHSLRICMQLMVARGGREISFGSIETEKAPVEKKKRINISRKDTRECNEDL